LAPPERPVVEHLPPEKLRVVKRSVVIAGHRTSVSLEQPFWAALQEIAARRQCSVNRLVAEIDAGRASEGQGNLSSALRVFVLECCRRGELPLTGPLPAPD